MPAGQGQVCDDPNLKLTPYAVSDIAYAVAQSNANYSAITRNHAQNFGGFAENLSWNWKWRDDKGFPKKGSPIHTRKIY